MIGKLRIFASCLVSDVMQAKDVGVAPSAGILHG
jgi:hypothetical protein